MKITNASATWQSVTTAADEIWQVRDGGILVDTDATEGDRLGILVGQGESIPFYSGRTVYYKLAHGTSALIARVAN